jgi:ketosteroid isomerase-like protein
MLIRHTLLPALVVAVSIGCGSTPKVDTAAEANVVRQRYADWVAVEKRRDLEGAMSFLAPDAVIQPEGAPAVKGIEAARDIWRAIFEIPYTDMVDVEPRTVVVSQSGDLAYDVGSFKIVIPGPDGPTEERAKSLVVWQKRDGQWVAVVNTWSMDAPAAPPAPGQTPDQ